MSYRSHAFLTRSNHANASISKALERDHSRADRRYAEWGIRCTTLEGWRLYHRPGVDRLTLCHEAPADHCERARQDGRCHRMEARV